MVTNVIHVYHDQMTHCGVEKTIQGILNTYWFPVMRKKVILIIVDSCTCFTWLFPNKTINSKEANGCLKNLFDPFGPPSEIVSDRGSAFTSFEFQTFVNSHSRKHRLATVASPWANGLVERIN
ncbi:Pro-Pol polyprotein [Trachymyrmex septentrionalis]|uniref:Pro-Pol polyprotein n=1 Tax=Trachymyrmex septentrionalis TaxID=34720 RepID=A0A151JUJ5_9HYME|nr:Pro-Pol polyprotein [Trachymyrmex septentrionalis]